LLGGEGIFYTAYWRPSFNAKAELVIQPLKRKSDDRVRGVQKRRAGGLEDVL
jgi:hypothetical protein